MTTTVSSSYSCTSTRAIVSGDICYNLAVTYCGGNQSLFTSLNPGINCSKLQIGQVVCIAGTPGATTSAVPTTTSVSTATTPAQTTSKIQKYF